MARDKERKTAVRFVKALVAGGVAQAADNHFVTGDPGIRLPAAAARALVSAGVLVEDRSGLRASREAMSWLRRVLVAGADDGFAAQHRIEVRSRDGVKSNLGESPLARLAASVNGEPPFLARHHREAGERVRRLVEKAQIQPRLTMSYSGAHTANGKTGSGAAEVTEMAAEARRALADICRLLPRDCAGVILDVCGLLKGLQAVEQERGWPRRSAKLVLRIGLDQLARHFGFASEAVGVDSRRPQAWLGEDARPNRFE